MQETTQTEGVKQALGAATIAASAVLGGSTHHDPLPTISHSEHESEVKRMSFKAWSEREKARANELVQAVLSKYKIDAKLAEQVVKLALKYEKPTFPKAEDILAVVGIESSFKPHAVSQLKQDPAVGLMQIRPAVWNLDKAALIGSIDKQIKVGTDILHKYYQRTKTPEGALQAYNVGITNYLKKKNLNPRYVPKFDKERDMYESQRVDLLKLQQEVIEAIDEAYPDISYKCKLVTNYGEPQIAVTVNAEGDKSLIIDLESMNPFTAYMKTYDASDKWSHWNNKESMLKLIVRNVAYVLGL